MKMSSNEPIYSKPIPKYNQIKPNNVNHRLTNRSLLNDHLNDRSNDKYSDCPQSNAVDHAFKNNFQPDRVNSRLAELNGQLDKNYSVNSSELSRSKLRSSNSRIKHNSGLTDVQFKPSKDSEMIRDYTESLDVQPLYVNESKFDRPRKLQLELNSDDYGFLNFESRRFGVDATKMKSPTNEYVHSESNSKHHRNKQNANKYEERPRNVNCTRLIEATPRSVVEDVGNTNSEQKSYSPETRNKPRTSERSIGDGRTKTESSSEQLRIKHEHRSSINKRSGNVSKEKDQPKSPKNDSRLIKHPRGGSGAAKSSGNDKRPDVGVGGVSVHRSVRHDSASKEGGGSLSDNAKRFYCRDWAFRKIAQCLEQRPMSRTCGALILGGSGSGKTTLCREIAGQNGTQNANKGTLGTLNRKLLAVYYVQAQKSDTLSMADFIRSLVLQLLSHSTYLQPTQPAAFPHEMQSATPKSSTLTDKQPVKQLVNNISLDEDKRIDQSLEEVLHNNADSMLESEQLVLKLRTTELDDKFCKNLAALRFEDVSTLNSKKIEEKDGDATENYLIGELILTERVKQFCDKKIENIASASEDVTEKCVTIEQRKQCVVIRQCSDPCSNQHLSISENTSCNYFTHPPSIKGQKEMDEKFTEPIEDKENKMKIENSSEKLLKSPPSRIPVARFKYPNMSDPNYSLNVAKFEHRQNVCLCNEEVSMGGESIANIDNLDGAIIDHTLDNDLDDSVIEQVNDTTNVIESSKDTINTNDTTDSAGIEDLHNVEVNRNLKPQLRPQRQFESVLRLSESTSNPPPLPSAPQNSRNYIANAYFEKLLTDVEIQESLNIENIDKNPDDCFKKAVLFPLLEIDPPKNCLLFIVDSIDEKSLTLCNLNNTLTKEQDKPSRSINNSKTIAELLANHHHLFPQWLLLVCTAKKQSKNLTKMFTGFRKISLDDLRKHQIVRDVQQYILARLDTELNLRQHISRDTAEMLNQLHIKSNGCFLYLEKVLDGVSDSFIVLREIKEIPGTLNGLYLWLCQRLFNKKQFGKVRPLFNILLAARSKVTKQFLYKCLLTMNYTITKEDFSKRLNLLRKVVKLNGNFIMFFHQSFAEWLVDVKHCTQKYLCSVLEGSCMIAMFYTLNAKSLCPNEIHNYIFHLTKVEQYLTQTSGKNGKQNDLTDWHFMTLLWLINSASNVEKSLYCGTELCDVNKCNHVDFMDNLNITPKTKEMIDKYHVKYNKVVELTSKDNNHLDQTTEMSDANIRENEIKFKEFFNDFFKPTLPRDNKVLRLLLESGAKTQVQDCTSSQMSLDSITDTQSISYINQSEDQMDDLFSLNDPLYIDTTSTINGSNIIHTLASEGNAVLLERAIQTAKRTIDLELEDRHGQTALNLAARHGHTNVVKVLLKAGAQPDHADCDGWTALRAAAWGGHTEVVELLVSHGCDVDRPDSDGRSALRAAAWSGHEDIIKVLLKAGASVNRTDQEGRTALIAAAYMGHSEIVEQLLDCGADINHSDSDGRSALSVAALCVPASAGYAKVVGVLLDRGASADHQDKEGMTPLLVAAFEGHKEVCELLLESEADPDLSENTGRVPLWGACSAGHSSVVELLLFWGAGIDCMDHEGRTVLSVACAQGNVEVVRQLLDRGLDETHRDNAGWTPLHYAAFEGHLEVVQALLESGAKVDEADNDGKSCLHLASQEGHSEVVGALLTQYAAPVDQRAHDGKTALRLAALEGHYEALRLLVQFNADVNTRDADGRSTLYVLALENKLAMARFLLEHGRADPNCRDCEGRTALHVSAWQGHAEMVSLLISGGGATVDALDSDCRTPLHSACWQGHSGVVEMLLKWGAQPDHACNQGATALGIASQEGHYDCVVKLLQYNADPYHSDHCGRTPLKLATKSQRTDVVRLLETYIKNRKTGSSNNSITSASTAIVRSPNISPESTHRLSCLSTDQHLAGHLIGHSTLLTGAPVTQGGLGSDTTGTGTGAGGQSLGGNLSSLSSNLTGSTHSSKHEQSTASIPFSQQLQSFTRYGDVGASHCVSNPHNSHVLSPLNSDSGSPLYASPPHSPISDIASPVNPPTNCIGSVGSKNTDNHFARDTHMRIILGGGSKDKEPVTTKSKRNAITTNPAFRLIRSGLDSAAANLRRTGQAFSQSHRQSDKSKNHDAERTEGGATKSGTFQWRRETPL